MDDGRTQRRVPRVRVGPDEKGEDQREHEGFPFGEVDGLLDKESDEAQDQGDGAVEEDAGEGFHSSPVFR